MLLGWECIFLYSCSAWRVSFQIKFINFKRNLSGKTSWVYEYTQPNWHSSEGLDCHTFLATALSVFPASGLEKFQWRSLSRFVCFFMALWHIYSGILPITLPMISVWTLSPNIFTNHYKSIVNMSLYNWILMHQSSFDADFNSLAMKNKEETSIKCSTCVAAKFSAHQIKNLLFCILSSTLNCNTTTLIATS